MRSRFAPIFAAFAAAMLAFPASAQENFDACAVFTLEDAQKVLGPDAAGEPANPKAKRPKVVPTCAYSATKDGKRVTASATFRTGRSNDEAQRAFEEARMKYQTKPMLISGADAFWSAKTGELSLRKGKASLTIAVGPAQLNLREVNDARKLAEILLKKL